MFWNQILWILYALHDLFQKFRTRFIYAKRSLKGLTFWNGPLPPSPTEDYEPISPVLSDIGLDLRSFEAPQSLGTSPPLPRVNSIHLPYNPEDADICLNDSTKSTLFQCSFLDLQPKPSAVDSHVAHELWPFHDSRSCSPQSPKPPQNSQEQCGSVTGFDCYLIQNCSARKLALDHLPNEIILQICEYLLDSEVEPNLGNQHLLLGVRGLSRKWRRIGEYVLWRSLRASPDLLNRHDLWCWYIGGITQRCLDATDTVSYSVLDGLDSLDGKYMDIFSAALVNCRRADITVLVQNPGFSKSENFQLLASYLRDFSWRSNLLGINEYLPSKMKFPNRILRDYVPWSFLVDLFLECPLSIDDTYFVLSAGHGSLERVSLGIIDFDASLGTSDRAAQKAHRAIIPVVLERLTALSIKSYLDLNSLFASLIIPRLSSLELHALIKSTSTPKYDVPSLFFDLDLSWNKLVRLTLHSQDVQPCPLNEILSRCEILEWLEWKGTTISSSPVPSSIPSICRLKAVEVPLQPSEPAVYLNFPCGHLTHLSLDSEGRQTWYLGRLLNKCDRLQSFEWKGFSSDFSLPPACMHRPLQNLRRLDVENDVDALTSILNLMTPHPLHITFPTQDSFYSNMEQLDMAKSISIRQPLSFCEAQKVFRHAETIKNIIQADVHIDRMLERPNDMRLENEFIQQLTLKLGEDIDLAFLFESMKLPEIKRMELFVQNKALTLADIDPFLVASNTLITTKSKKRIHPNTEVWTIGFTSGLGLK